jgi:hypothetical protein
MPLQFFFRKPAFLVILAAIIWAYPKTCREVFPDEVNIRTVVNAGIGQRAWAPFDSRVTFWLVFKPLTIGML